MGGWGREGERERRKVGWRGGRRGEIEEMPLKDVLIRSCA